MTIGTRVRIKTGMLTGREGVVRDITLTGYGPLYHVDVTGWLSVTTVPYRAGELEAV